MLSRVEAQAYKTCGTCIWILHNTIGDKTSSLVMERDNALLKCTRAEAILALMEFYHLGILPYPAQVTGPLLLLQEFVLHDRIQSAVTNPLNKAKEEFKTYTSKKKNDLFDSFF